MKRSLLLAAGLLAAVTTASIAQTPPPPQPPAGAGPSEAAPPPPPPGGPGEMRPGPRGPGPHGMGPRGPGPHGPRMMMKGFDIRLGDGVRLRVQCGDEPIAACIEAAAPLIDTLAVDAGDMDDDRGN